MILDFYFHRNCNELAASVDYLHFGEQVESLVCHLVSKGRYVHFNKLSRPQKKEALIKTRQIMNNPTMLYNLHMREYNAMANRILSVIRPYNRKSNYRHALTS